MSGEDYASKAVELRRRAAEAPSDALRAIYLRGADSYENLARRPPSLDTRGDVEALKAELSDLRQHVVALENSLTICLALLRRHVPGLTQALEKVDVEPHPDTPAEQKAVIQSLAARIRRILGQKKQ